MHDINLDLYIGHLSGVHMLMGSQCRTSYLKSILMVDLSVTVYEILAVEMGINLTTISRMGKGQM